LIRIHNSDEAFLSNLHVAVHGDFIECLEVRVSQITRRRRA